MDFSDGVLSSFNLITGAKYKKCEETHSPRNNDNKTNCLELCLPGNPYLGVIEVIVGVLSSVY